MDLTTSWEEMDPWQSGIWDVRIYYVIGVSFPICCQYVGKTFNERRHRENINYYQQLSVQLQIKKANIVHLRQMEAF